MRYVPCLLAALLACSVSYADTKLKRASWVVARSASAPNDGETVMVGIRSAKMIKDSTGIFESLGLGATCTRGKTTVALFMGHHFMRDDSSYGYVSVKRDAERAMQTHFDADATHTTMMIADSDKAVAFLRSLYGHKTLTIIATPGNEAPLTVEFDIEGVEEQLQSIGSSCDWKRSDAE
jgi:hypothetical protein